MCKILTFSEVTLKSILACFYRTFEVLKFGGKLVVKDKQMLVKSTSATCHINNQYNLDHKNGVRRHMTRSTYFCQKKVLIFTKKKLIFAKNKYFFQCLPWKIHHQGGHHHHQVGDGHGRGGDGHGWPRGCDFFTKNK